LLLRARVSVSCYWRKAWRRHAVPLPGRGLLLQEVAARMKVMHERVAGIDVHKQDG